MASQYLETVTIPVYDSGNAEHCLIPTDEPWSSDTLNNMAYKHFYIEPGDYGTTALSISSAGTSGENRTLSLHNPAKPLDDTHPGALPDNEQASCRFYIYDNAAYWTIDRMSLLDADMTHSVQIGINKTSGSNG